MGRWWWSLLSAPWLCAACGGLAQTSVDGSPDGKAGMDVTTRDRTSSRDGMGGGDRGTSADSPSDARDARGSNVNDAVVALDSSDGGDAGSADAPLADGPTGICTPAGEVACVDGSAGSCPAGSDCTTSSGHRGVCCSSGTCTDVSTDPMNCGGCGRATWLGASCISGSSVFSSCTSAPPGGPCASDAGASGTCCNGTCRASTSYATDPQNCGGCGLTCPTGATCAGGTCSSYCTTGPCPVGTVCQYFPYANPGFCGIDVCTPATEGRPCGELDPALLSLQTTVCCSSKCVDLSSDPANCGTCGHACAGSELCFSGACVVTAPCSLATQDAPCELGGSRQGACCSGVCVDESSDPGNCSGCGRSCPATTKCGAGSCNVGGSVGSCFAGSTTYFTCPAGTTCSDDGAQCVPSACSKAGESACYHVAASEAVCCGAGAGGCPDFTSDPRNCGACGVVCPSGVCLWGLRNPGDTSNGGYCFPAPSCSSDCSAEGGCPPGSTCADGVCVEPGSACDGLSVGDGPLCATSAGHVGVCCSPPYATGPTCVDPMTDPDHCGGCGVTCPSGSCSCGVCTP